LVRLPRPFASGGCHRGAFSSSSRRDVFDSTHNLTTVSAKSGETRLRNRRVFLAI
jgi:hypothetical protein